ncbi:MAG TPA: cyclic peptide export ABC transporter [Opitutaceae bacterium]|nr:cyclic peptide export ABC transporter [Opitutaceae bacterium]HPG18344.1 cyclic peptide export ABC transporter [Opitutaceae bacterium]
MKHFLDFIRKESTDFRAPIIVAIVLAGLINGVGVTVATAAVGSLKPGKVDFSSLLLFCGCIVGYWITKELVLNRTTTILEDIIERLRLRILGKLRDTDLIPFEGLDKGRIYATLSSDAVSISMSAGMVINASSALVMLGFTLVLIAFISMKALLIISGLIAVVIVYYMRHSRRVGEELGRATTRENEFFDNLNGFLAGFKELKLNRDKRTDYFKEEIETVVHATNTHRVAAGKALNHSLLIAHTYVFFTLAGLIFILPIISPSETSIVSILVPIVLFSAGPLADVIMAVPALAKAEANIVNIYELENAIDRRIAEHAGAHESTDFVSPPAQFEHLRAEALSFQYPAKGRHPFRIQPADFELKAGQIVFIVGGNGSGKSTLLKMLTGLYRPSGGRLLLNGEEIHDGNVTMLRELFSPIFTDFHLFKRILGKNKVDEKRIAELLTRMELADKTGIENGRVTNLDLSTGQRKRLSLIMSTLDDRPIHLFDEWAADQDPLFRKFFYEVLLRQMVAEGKTILAVTHDDHYFHVADKVYMMEYGRLMDYVPPSTKRKRPPSTTI